jgi:hypothetical protein
MRIPTQNLQQTFVNPRPLARVQSNAGDMLREKGERTSMIVTALGKTAQAGAESYVAIRQANETARTQDAMLELDEANGKSYDELVKRKGANAQGIEEEAAKLYESNKKAASAKLKSSREIDAFDKATRRDRMSWDNKVRDHATKEADAYQSDQTEAWTARAKSDRYDPSKTDEDRANSTAKAEAGIRARAQRQGLAPELLQLQIESFRSESAQMSISGHLDRNNLDEAKKAWATAQAQGTILPQNRQQIENMLEAKGQEQKELAEISRITQGKNLTLGDDFTAALAEARKIPDAKLQDKVVNRLEERERQDQYSKQKKENEAFNKAYTELDKTGKVADSTKSALPAPMQMRIDEIAAHRQAKAYAAFSAEAKIKVLERSKEIRGRISQMTMAEFERLPVDERVLVIDSLEGEDKEWFKLRQGERKVIEDQKAKTKKEAVELLRTQDKKGVWHDASPADQQKVQEEFERTFAQLEADQKGNISEAHLLLVKRSILARATGGKPVFQLSPTERLSRNVKAFDSVDDLKTEVPELQDPERYKDLVAKYPDEAAMLEDLNRRAVGASDSQWQRAILGEKQNEKARARSQADEEATIKAKNEQAAQAKAKAANEDRDHDSYGGRVLDAFGIPTKKTVGRWIFRPMGDDSGWIKNAGSWKAPEASVDPTAKRIAYPAEGIKIQGAKISREHWESMTPTKQNEIWNNKD